MSNNNSFSPVSRVIVVSAALVVVIAGMKAAAPMLLPFLMSAFIAVISYPLMSRLQQSGLPQVLALSLVILLVILIGFALTLLVGTSITDFSRSIPAYQEKISGEWLAILQWLAEHGVSVSETIKETIDPGAAVGLVSSILKGFGNVLTNSFLILLTVIFILLEAGGLTEKLLQLQSDESLKHSDKPELGDFGDALFVREFASKLRNYMSLKTIISIVTGVIIGSALWLIGLDYPILWGVLAFLLNFVPNIGSIIAAVPAVLLALVQLGVTPALLVAAVYIATNVIIGSVVEPRYMGKELGLSTLVVFVSLVFWGWVLGPVGMLLSVPLTITLKLALDSKAETRWLSHLLGPVDA